MLSTLSRTGLTLVLATFTLILGACAQVMPPCNAVNTPPVRDLASSQWELIRWHYTSAHDGKTRLRTIPHRGNDSSITLLISPDGTSASGYTGCNAYHAQVATSDWGFILEKIASTRKTCSPHLGELEFKLLSYLGDYRTMVRDGDRLLIMTRDGEVLSFAQKN
jgi:heat shock protein HslJ